MPRSFFNSRSGLFMCITGRGDDDDVCVYMWAPFVTEKHVIRTRWSPIETIPR